MMNFRLRQPHKRQNQEELNLYQFVMKNEEFNHRKKIQTYHHNQIEEFEKHSEIQNSVDQGSFLNQRNQFSDQSKNKIMTPRYTQQQDRVSTSSFSHKKRDLLELSPDQKQELKELKKTNQIMQDFINVYQNQNQHKNLPVSLKPKQGFDNPNLLMSMIRRARKNFSQKPEIQEPPYNFNLLKGNDGKNKGGLDLSFQPETPNMFYQNLQTVNRINNNDEYLDKVQQNQNQTQFQKLISCSRRISEDINSIDSQTIQGQMNNLTPNMNTRQTYSGFNGQKRSSRASSQNSGKNIQSENQNKTFYQGQNNQNSRKNWVVLDNVNDINLLVSQRPSTSFQVKDPETDKQQEEYKITQVFYKPNMNDFGSTGMGGSVKNAVQFDENFTNNFNLNLNCLREGFIPHCQFRPKTAPNSPKFKFNLTLLNKKNPNQNQKENDSKTKFNSDLQGQIIITPVMEEKEKKNNNNLYCNNKKGQINIYDNAKKMITFYKERDQEIQTGKKKNIIKNINFPKSEKENICHSPIFAYSGFEIKRNSSSNSSTQKNHFQEFKLKRKIPSKSINNNNQTFSHPKQNQNSISINTNNNTSNDIQNLFTSNEVPNLFQNEQIIAKYSPKKKKLISFDRKKI